MDGACGETRYVEASGGGTELGKLHAMSTENLRREARVDVRVPVVVYRGRSPVALETSDVSFKGLFVRTTDPPALRSLVRLKVALFDREFEAHAMAVHVVGANDTQEGGEVHEPGVGLQFWGLSGPDRTAWDDFVRGLVHARRAVAKKSSESAHPALSEPSTPSGVRIVAKAPHISSK
jgi:PilZ domain-containing protein